MSDAKEPEEAVIESPVSIDDSDKEHENARIWSLLDEAWPMVIPEPMFEPEPETPEEPEAGPTPVKTYYRKRHSVSEAIQWTGDNEDEMSELVGTVLGEGDVQVPRFRAPDEEHKNARIWSLFDEAWHEVPANAWAVKEKFANDFEFRVVSDEFFATAYVEYSQQ